jgi:uncharacterized protein
LVRQDVRPAKRGTTNTVTSEAEPYRTCSLVRGSASLVLRRYLCVLRDAAFLLCIACAAAAQELPQLTAPVNDFADVIDPESERAIESVIRSLQRATGDVIVVATVGTYAPFGDISDFALKLFENRGRGIGQRGKDNGLLVVVAVRERRVRIEVGYDLEQFVTDGFAGQTSRQDMAPHFRQGRYGVGLLAGVSRLTSRIAEGRNVSLEGVPQPRRDTAPIGSSGVTLLIGLFMAIVLLRVIGGMFSAAAFGTTRRRYHRRWGGSPWSGWHSGVGPFGGGGFGRGGGGFGGGFGGFGGGRSGGGGGGASW